MMDNKEIIQAIKETVCKYTDDFIYAFENKKIKREEYDDVLLFCSEIYDVSFLKKYKNKIRDIIETILSTIKNELYSGDTTYLNYMGQSKGIGNIAFSLRILNQKGIHLNQFQKYCDCWMDEFYKTQIVLYYKTQTVPVLYDVIYGVSGMLNYYLEYRKEQKDIILGMLKYLIYLTDKNEEKVTKYFVIKLSEYKNTHSKYDLYLDFGMAHGIIGPLYIMAKAMHEGFQTKGLQESIQFLKDLYVEFMRIDDKGRLQFPTQLKLSGFKQKEVTDYTFNNGWCYGNGSIVFGLMKVAKYCEEELDYRFYKNELLKIMSGSLIDNNLFEPIVCHGYAGLLMIQICAYLETQDRDFLITIEEKICETLKYHEKNIGEERYINNYSLLEGASGVMLALLKVLGKTIESSKLLFLD